MKRIMALFVALLMLLSVFPMAFAQDADTGDDEPAADECLEVEESCCIGEVCNTAEVLCEEGSEHVFKGCDSDCNAIAVCEETDETSAEVPTDAPLCTDADFTCGMCYQEDEGEYLLVSIECPLEDEAEDETEEEEEVETGEGDEAAVDEDEAADEEEVITEEEEEEAGVTPDKPLLWGLDRAIERISLALTLGKAAKAKKGLAHARERLLEVKAMIAEKKLDAAEKAKEKHGKALGRVKRAVEEIDGEFEPEEQLEEQTEIETEIEEQEQEMEEVKEKAKKREKLQLTEEQMAKIEAMVSDLKEDLGDAKVKVRAKKAKIRIAIQAKTGKSAEEVNALGEEIKARGRGRRAAEEPVETPEEVNIDGTVAIGATE